MLVIITTTVISAYLALVFGTLKKFNNNGIQLTHDAKIFIFFLPLIIWFIHVKLSIKLFAKDKRKAIEIFKMGTLYYPVALGILIEIALENYACKKVFGESVHYNEKDSIELHGESVNDQKSKIINIYQKTTVDMVML